MAFDPVDSDGRHDRLFEIPYKAEPDIWLRQNGNVHKYVAVYADNLALALKDPQALLDQLTSNPCNFKLKGSGPITFHLGMDFFHDSDSILCMAPKKYIKKMIANHKQLFGEKPK